MDANLLREVHDNRTSNAVTYPYWRRTENAVWKISTIVGTIDRRRARSAAIEQGLSYLCCQSSTANNN
jgi:hypothetical protein